MEVVRLAQITINAITVPLNLLLLQEMALQLAEDKAQGTISVITYYRYFRAGASVVVLLLMLGIFLLGEVCTLQLCFWSGYFNLLNSSWVINHYPFFSGGRSFIINCSNCMVLAASDRCPSLKAASTIHGYYN